MLLGAYYYLWYGSPTVPIVGGGDWERAGSTNRPVLAKYNSRDKKVISRHISWAKEAGLDFFAVSWGNIASWDDITLKDYYLKHPKSSKMQFCIFYDSIPALNRHRFDIYQSYDFNSQFSPLKTKGEKFIEDFVYLADNYFHRPGYLKIDGRPVVIIYNTSAFKNIQSYFAELKEKMAERDIDLFLIADAVCWAGVKLSKSNLGFLWTTPPSETVKVVVKALGRLTFQNLKEMDLGRYFQAITAYNLYASHRTENFLKNTDDLYDKFNSYARSNNLYFVPNLMPGYDDRKLMGLGSPPLERKNSQFYKNFWQIAKKYVDSRIPMTMVTSFNEWHEGTEIEPSEEYGNRYLEITNSFKDVGQLPANKANKNEKLKLKVK